MNALSYSRFLDLYAANQEEKLDKHRFLVQTKVVEAADFERISKMDPQDRPDQVTNFITKGYVVSYSYPSYITLSTLSKSSISCGKNLLISAKTSS